MRVVVVFFSLFSFSILEKLDAFNQNKIRTYYMNTDEQMHRSLKLRHVWQLHFNSLDENKPHKPHSLSWYSFGK